MKNKSWKTDFPRPSFEELKEILVEASSKVIKMDKIGGVSTPLKNNHQLP